LFKLMLGDGAGLIVTFSVVVAEQAELVAVNV
jgi:hypothetical protein